VGDDYDVDFGADGLDDADRQSEEAERDERFADEDEGGEPDEEDEDARESRELDEWNEACDLAEETLDSDAFEAWLGANPEPGLVDDDDELGDCPDCGRPAPRDAIGRTVCMNCKGAEP
jgi:hypothetical protein